MASNLLRAVSEARAGHVAVSRAGSFQGPIIQGNSALSGSAEWVRNVPALSADAPAPFPVVFANYDLIYVPYAKILFGRAIETPDGPIDSYTTLDERIISFTYTSRIDSMGAGNTIEVEMNNPAPYGLTELPNLWIGSYLTAVWGYLPTGSPLSGQLGKEMPLASVDGQIVGIEADYPSKGGCTLSIRALALDSRIKRNRSRRLIPASYEGPGSAGSDARVLDVARAITEEFNMQFVGPHEWHGAPGAIGAEAYDIRLPAGTLPITGQNAFEQLKTLAGFMSGQGNRDPWHVMPRGNTIFFLPLGAHKIPVYAFYYGSDPVGTLMSFNIDYSPAGAGNIGFTSNPMDTGDVESGITYPPGTEDNTEDDAESANSEGTATDADGDSVEAFLDSASDPEETQRQAGSYLTNSQQDGIQAKARTIGIPEVLAQDMILVLGIGRMWSGLYQIGEVKHHISRGGYSLDMMLQGNSIQNAPMISDKLRGPRKTRFTNPSPHTGGGNYGRLPTPGLPE